MAAIDTSRPVALTSGRATSFFVDTFAAVVAWNDARKTRLALSQLSARELDDIGLTYADVFNMSTPIIR